MKLQQYLPLAVLKHQDMPVKFCEYFVLQQYLPLAVLKQYIKHNEAIHISWGCNSTYRLRY